jgi:hypothetical protein
MQDIIEITVPSLGRQIFNTTLPNAWEPDDAKPGDIIEMFAATDHGTALVTDDGAGAISSWKGRYGALNFTASGTHRPVWQTDANGAQYISLDGVDDYLECTNFASVLPVGSSDVILLAVVKSETGSGIGTIFVYGGTGGGTNRQLRKDSANRAQISDGLTSLSRGTRANSFAGPGIVAGLWRGTIMAGEAGGVAFTSAPVTFAHTGILTTRARIGASLAATPTNYYEGGIAFIFVLPGDASQELLDRICFWASVQVNDPDVCYPSFPYYWGTNTDDVPPAYQLPAYFTPADSALAELNGPKVFMPTGSLVPSSTDDESTNPYWPLTDAVSQSLDILTASTWSGRKWGFGWNNRADGLATSHNQRPNPIWPTILTRSLKQGRASFTTYAKAIGATLVQAMHRLGYTEAEYQAAAVAAGFSTADIIPWATLAADPDTYFTIPSTVEPSFALMSDKIWISPYTLGASNYVLDYEPQDGRATSDTTSALTDIAAKVHAKSKLWVFYSNPLDGALAPFNGLDATNIPTILSLADYMGVLLKSSANITTSYAAQKTLLGL